MASNYRIGATYETLTALDELETPVIEPTALPPAYPESIRLGDNSEREIGSPLLVWDFSLLEIDQRNELKGFCTGKSAEVFISSDLADGTFADFSATLVWPSAEPAREIGVKMNISLEFRNVLELGPFS